MEEHATREREISSTKHPRKTPSSGPFPGVLKSPFHPHSRRRPPWRVPPCVSRAHGAPKRVLCPGSPPQRAIQNRKDSRWLLRRAAIHSVTVPHVSHLVRVAICYGPALLSASRGVALPRDSFWLDYGAESPWGESFKREPFFFPPHLLFFFD